MSLFPALRRAAVSRDAHRSEGGVQGVFGALGVQQSAQVIGGAAQRGVGTVSAGVPGEAGAVQAGHAPLQLECAQIPHLAAHTQTSILEVQLSLSLGDLRLLRPPQPPNLGNLRDQFACVLDLQHPRIHAKPLVLWWSVLK